MQRALELAGAPDDLIAWVEEIDVLEPWESCQKGDWLLWLVACARLPLEDIVEATRTVLERIVTSHGPPAKPAADVLGMLGRRNHNELAKAIEHLEQLAHADVGNYRGGAARGAQHVMRAVALLGHAVEALDGITEQVAAQRITEDIAQGSAPKPTGSAVLEPGLIPRDPTQQVLGFVITATAEAAHEAALARAERDDDDAIEAAEAEIADELYELLTEDR